MNSQIGRCSNLAFRIPKYVVEELSLQPNDEVYCHIKDGKLVIETVRDIEEYTLDRLLEGVIEPSEEISRGKPEGNEEW